VGADGADIVVNRAPWPSPAEQSAAELVALDEPCVLVPGLVESGVE
jgi:hypothetical protein